MDNCINKNRKKRTITKTNRQQIEMICVLLGTISIHKSCLSFCKNRKENLGIDND